jgi:pimeloyl-ACP methyl ester carboxylesterase
MSHFIMIHGSWSVGQMWERGVPLLKAAGHTTDAPTLLGAGRHDSEFPDKPISSWADQVAALVRKADRPVVLVAQSRGGLVISEVAERVPELVGYLVYVSAFLLQDGSSLAGTVQSAHPGAPPIFTVDKSGMTTLIPEMFDRIYSNTPTQWVEVARNNQRLEPLAAITTPISISEARFGSVPRAYVETTEDQILPLGLQRSMQAKLPCNPVFSIATDHVPPTSAPEELASYLIEIANLVEQNQGREQR